MAIILQRQTTRMRVKETSLPQNNSGVLLGRGIDVTNLPEGHLCCSKCHGYKFECWMFGDNRRIEMGCIECGESERLLFPLDVELAKATPTQYLGQYNALGEGRFQCRRHPDKAMVLIHNVDVVSIGCECCFTEMNICLRKAKGIILTDGK